MSFMVRESPQLKGRIDLYHSVSTGDTQTFLKSCLQSLLFLESILQAKNKLNNKMVRKNIVYFSVSWLVCFRRKKCETHLKGTELNVGVNSGPQDFSFKFVQTCRLLSCLLVVFGTNIMKAGQNTLKSVLHSDNTL